MRTRARKVDGGYVLDGQKAWISNGGIAQFYVVFATVAPGTGHRGVTAFLLDRDDDGTLVRRADARRWASGRSRTPSCSSRTASSPTTAGSAPRARASAG